MKVTNETFPTGTTGKELKAGDVFSCYENGICPQIVSFRKTRDNQTGDVFEDKVSIDLETGEMDEVTDALFVYRLNAEVIVHGFEK